MKLSELIREELRISAETGADLPKAIIARLHECVKPLEWDVYCISGNTSAIALCGEYVAESTGPKMIGLWSPASTDEMAEPDLGYFETIEAAKAGAQAHYAAQIIAGLDV